MGGRERRKSHTHEVVERGVGKELFKGAHIRMRHSPQRPRFDGDDDRAILVRREPLRNVTPSQSPDQGRLGNPVLCDQFRGKDPVVCPPLDLEAEPAAADADLFDEEVPLVQERAQGLVRSREGSEAHRRRRSSSSVCRMNECNPREAVETSEINEGRKLAIKQSPLRGKARPGEWRRERRGGTSRGQLSVARSKPRAATWRAQSRASPFVLSYYCNWREKAGSVHAISQEAGRG